MVTHQVTDLQQSLTEPLHNIQVHVMSLGISLLSVLILTLHNHIPEEHTNAHAAFTGGRNARSLSGKQKRKR